MKKCITGKKKSAGYMIICIFWLIIWQAAAMITDKPLILPSPVDAAEALIELSSHKNFYMDIGWTMLRCLTSMALSLILGSLCAAASYRFPAVQKILSLPVGFFKAVPVMAIIIYVILIAPAGLVAVIVCFFMCFPVVYTNILSGLLSMGREYKELARICGLGSKERIRLIYIPAIMPQLNAALRLIAGLGFKAVVAAEVLAIPKFSLGYEMINSKYYLNTPNLLAYISVIVILSIAIERLAVLWTERTKPEDYRGSRLYKVKKDVAFTDTEKTVSKGILPQPPSVRLKNICKSFGKENILSNVNERFDSGTITIIQGPSGIGKTTLARILAGLEKPDEGTVIAENAKIAFLFQEDRLLPWLNVYDNLALAVPPEKRNDEKNILQMAEALEIEDVLWCLPEKLSGGMKHRVALGRTFLTLSNMMILDEPFRGLDEPLRERIMHRLWKNVTRNKTVIVITHKPQDFDGRIIRMDKEFKGELR